MSDRRICQMVFSALDAAALRNWYQQVFGLVKAWVLELLSRHTLMN